MDIDTVKLLKEVGHELWSAFNPIRITILFLSWWLFTSHVFPWINRKINEVPHRSEVFAIMLLHYVNKRLDKNHNHPLKACMDGSCKLL